MGVADNWDIKSPFLRPAPASDLPLVEWYIESAKKVQQLQIDCMSSNDQIRKYHCVDAFFKLMFF